MRSVLQKVLTVLVIDTIIFVLKCRAYIEFERQHTSDSQSIVPPVYKAIKMR